MLGMLLVAPMMRSQKTMNWKSDKGLPRIEIVRQYYLMIILPLLVSAAASWCQLILDIYGKAAM